MDPNIEFLKSEFEAAHTYFISIEQKIFEIFKLYSTIFLGTTAAFFYIYFSMQPVGKYLDLSILLTIVFEIFGLYELNAFAELRIRKIKILEQLAIIRKYFKENKEGKDISQFLIMIVGLDKCPQYLRRPSDDWYTSTFMIFVNSLVFGVFGYLMSLKWRLSWILSLTIAMGVLLIIFYLQYRYMTRLYFVFDYERRRKFNVEYNYDLFPSEPRLYPKWIRILDSLARFEEKRQKDTLDKFYTKKDLQDEKK